MVQTWTVTGEILSTDPAKVRGGKSVFEIKTENGKEELVIVENFTRLLNGDVRINVEEFSVGDKVEIITNRLYPSIQALQINLLSPDASELAVYKKVEGWGPCPKGGFCSKETTLYSSGRFIVIGKTKIERILDYNVVNSVVKKIIDTNIMIKDCPEKIIFDYRTYAVG